MKMWSEYEKKLVYVLCAILLIGAVFFGREFVSVNTLIILGNQLPEYGLISVALMITLLVGGMNLSIVAMTTLSGVVGGLVMEQLVRDGTMSSTLGIITMILVGTLAGAINGSIISYLKVSPILTTLGTMLFFRGLALNLTKGGAITSFQPSFTQ
ncbi:MAG: ABC transporter permease, partial [Vallitaleaceae bacterium]|nr:ABC transporter permease [Vallitaleaceae bacterium]